MFTAKMCEKVTHTVKVEPTLQPLTSKEMQQNHSEKGISDVNAGGFQSRGQTALFDFRIFNRNTQHHQKKALGNVTNNERYQKRKCSFRNLLPLANILTVESIQY